MALSNVFPSHPFFSGGKSISHVLDLTLNRAPFRSRRFSLCADQPSPGTFFVAGSGLPLSVDDSWRCAGEGEAWVATSKGAREGFDWTPGSKSGRDHSPDCQRLLDEVDKVLSFGKPFPRQEMMRGDVFREVSRWPVPGALLSLPHLIPELLCNFHHQAEFLPAQGHLPSPLPPFPLLAPFILCANLLLLEQRPAPRQPRSPAFAAQMRWGQGLLGGSFLQEGVKPSRGPPSGAHSEGALRGETRRSLNGWRETLLYGRHLGRRLGKRISAAQERGTLRCARLPPEEAESRCLVTIP